MADSVSYLICGLGQAGGKIVDEMFGHGTLGRLATPFVINSTAKDLSLLENVPPSHWVGISEDKGLIAGDVPGFENQVVGGFGKDPIRADEVMEKNYAKVVAFFKDYAWKHALDKPIELNDETAEWAAQMSSDADPDEEGEWTELLESIPFALLVVGLGGGTGCGIAAKVAKAIRESSSVNTTIFVLGVLPATFDGGGKKTGVGRQAANAVFALKGMEPHVDGVFLVDNEALAHTGNPESHFEEFNQFIASTFVELLGAHLIEEIDLRGGTTSALPMIDIQDIRSAVTLTGPKGKRIPGYTSVGWGAVTTQTPMGFVTGLGKHSVDLVNLTNTCLRKQTLVGVVPREAQKSLGLLRLPIAMLKGSGSYPQTSDVEALLAECSSRNEVHFGITATKRNVASLIGLFTFERAQVARIQRLIKLADDYRKGQAA